jgi:hypothetical protein
VRASLGANAGVLMAGDISIRRTGANPVFAAGSFEDRTSGDLAAGAELRVFVHPRVSVLLGGVRGGYGQLDRTMVVDGVTWLERGEVDGTYYLIRAGASYHLPRIPLALTVAPALAREHADYGDLTPEPYRDPIHHFALSLGAHFAIPLEGSNFSFRMSADDYVVFWNRRELVRRDEAHLRQTYGGDWTATYDLKPAHLFTFQLGVAYALGGGVAARAGR